MLGFAARCVDDSAMIDKCYSCRSEVEAWDVMGPIEAGNARSYHTCDEGHAWWTDWKGTEVLERIAIMDPAKGDGGTTWSGVELARY